MTSNIIEDLRPLAVPVDNLVPDPDNARRGDIPKVKRSLTVFGQRKPIVVRRTGRDPQGRGTGVVEAGNHTLAAAVELGWTEVAAVFADDDEQMGKAFGLADNRTGEVADWDYDLLASHIDALQEGGFDDLDALGWGQDEIAALIQSSTPPDLDEVADEVGDPEPDDGWPTISVRVPHTVKAAWNEHLSNHGENGAAAMAALLRVDLEQP